MHCMDIGLIPQQATQRTHLQVTVPLETLLGLPGAPGADLEFSPQPISAKTVERLACDASVTRIVLDPKSQVIDVGRAERTIKGPRRKALNVRDRGCTWPVCERPASWTSGHHIKHWLHGGTNEQPNLTLLCYRHHWMVHEGGWQIVRGDDGRMIKSRLPSHLDHLHEGPTRRAGRMFMQFAVYSCVHAKGGEGGCGRGERLCRDDTGEPTGSPPWRAAQPAHLSVVCRQVLFRGLSAPRAGRRIPAGTRSRWARCRVQLPAA